MSVALTSSPAPTSTRQEPLRVMVVDDSVVIRGMISRWIGTEPDMVVAASLRTGLDAVNQLERVNPDVAVLDIEMPALDGISAPPQRGNQLQGPVAGRIGLHPKTRKHARSGRRRDFSPRSDPEDSPPRRQGA